MSCQSTCKDKRKKYLRCGRRKGNLPHANARLLSFAVKTMQANFILILWRDFAIAEGFFKMQARFLPSVDVSRGFRATCRQNIYFAMFACSCKGRRFQNRCVKCGTTCSPVFTVELILLFFVQTTLFLLAFKKLSGCFAKKLFLDFKHFLFLAFFKIKCCLFRLIAALSRFFYFFLLTQPCFYLLSKNLSGCFAKNFFSFVNFSFFRRFSQRTVARFR